MNVLRNSVVVLLGLLRSFVFGFTVVGCNSENQAKMTRGIEVSADVINPDIRGNS